MKTKKIVINVTQRDVDAWVNRKATNIIDLNPCTCCAVAKAVRRHKILSEARVNTETINTPGVSGISIALSQYVRDKIHDMDLKIPTTAFKFTIEVPISS